MKAFLNRITDDGFQTIGKLVVYDDDYKQRFTCFTIEPAWKDNQRNISCIPTGTYHVIKHNSPRFGPCLWLQDVPGRSEILVHVGNFRRNTSGCVLVGDQLKRIDKDPFPDVYRSTKTMRRLLAVLPDSFTLTIS